MQARCHQTELEKDKNWQPGPAELDGFSGNEALTAP